jgi:succinate dehydrogenase / fumarate reductase cytochrome b subunit
MGAKKAADILAIRQACAVDYDVPRPTLRRTLLSIFSRNFMADTPHLAPRARPLSPHLGIYRWPVTMATSIVHRMTGLALAAGTILLCWWLIAVASGPGAFNEFTSLATTPLGQVILFGFVWSLAYHLLNGVRHLAWDLGYGFAVPTANKSGIAVIALSVVLAIAVFVLAYAGHGGYYQ